jgi:hypothetical protein
MATTFTKYTHTPRRFSDGTLDWDTDTFKLALVTSSYTFSAAHDEWADASAAEVATGDGYTTGGEELTASIDNTKLDADNVTWTALTKTFRGAVLYKVGSANGLTNPLVGYILFDDTPADISVPGIDFTVVWDADGVFSLS